MKKKIVFIVNILRQPRCIRRICDFMNNDYDVKVYGFDRKEDSRALPGFDFESIGIISHVDSYTRRLLMMKRSLANVIKKEGGDSIYYIFSLDVAIAVLFVKRNIKFCYEISDLMELQINNKWLSNLLVCINRIVVTKSILNVYTSEGFVQFLNKKRKFADKTVILPNKLNRDSIELPAAFSRNIDINNIRFGFTGNIRTETIFNFIKTIGEFGKHEVHLYGIFTDEHNQCFSIRGLVDKYSNVFYHGPFRNPQDFPGIYKNIDVILSYYYSSKNDLYLEPNKLYEAIYYKCPIIVADGTFVGQKVKSLNIGYAISPCSNTAIIDCIKSIDKFNYEEKIEAICSISREDALDNPKVLFDKLSTVFYD